MRASAAFTILAAMAAGSGMASCAPAPFDEIVASPSNLSQGPANLVLRRRGAVWGAGPAYAVLLDGQPIAQLGSDETKTLPVPAGAHEVEVRCGGEAPDASAKAQVAFEAGRSYKMDVYQTDDYRTKEAVCRLRAIGS
jgi:hypothetical protein